MFTRLRITWPNMVQLICALTVVAAICGALYLQDANQIAQGNLDREYRRMEIFSGLFGRDVSSVVSDLRQMSTGDSLQAYLTTGQQADLERAVNRAVFFSRENADYDQIRFLGETGQEKYRVNRNGAIVPDDQLQNKGDRPYFQKAWALNPGEIYLSAIDLNVERGAIEQPPKPMLRLAAPVYDATGAERGVFVINDLAANLIDRLRDFTPQYRQRLRLLNAQGYWLAGARPDEEWGFMLPGRSGLTMARTDPELWAKIVSEPRGQEPYQGGYFTWVRAVPREFARGRPIELKAEDDFLVFASQISPQEWNAAFVEVREAFAVVGLLLLILTTVVTWFLQARRQAEKEVMKSQEMFRGLFESSPDAIVLVDLAGRIDRINSQAEATFGYTRKELIGQRIEMLMPERFRSRHGAHLAAYFAAPRTRAMGAGLELYALHKDGSEFPVDIMLSALETAEGGHGMAVIRNISSRRQAAERIEKLNEELKERARQLEGANKELESFSYSVSHDLRAPLRHINGFVELLQKSPLFASDPNSQRQMNVIARAAKEMGRLIDDLLDFSRTGRAEMHSVKIDMREMIDHFIKERETECAGRKIVWEIKELPKVAGDPRLLRLVWMNLIDNALKYTRPREEAKIEIGCLGAAEGGKPADPQEVVFYVRDNGVGFDMRYASKLFGVFQRLHKPEDFEGTGIGLANVQRIILRHGGRVWGEGEVGSGATFYFSLPTELTKHV